jgi:hypothetical protein
MNKEIVNALTEDFDRALQAHMKLPRNMSNFKTVAESNMRKFLIHLRLQQTTQEGFEAVNNVYKKYLNK